LRLEFFIYNSCHGGGGEFREGIEVFAAQSFDSGAQIACVLKQAEGDAKGVAGKLSCSRLAKTIHSFVITDKSL
jgi:hypothetical protein